jgi:hypothetical protein
MTSEIDRFVDNDTCLKLSRLGYARSSHVRLYGQKLQIVASLAIKMVQTGKHVVFPLVYKLIELALLLPVSTASVERSFSAMNIIKRELRNKIEDDWMNDLMVCYTEKEIFKSLDDEIIIRRFQRLKTRRMQLPRSSRT